MRVYYKGDGHYPGTYSFKDEVVGTAGTDIDFIDSINTAAKCEIISEHNGHRKVLKITANNLAGNVATNLFAESQTSGTIEYYFETSHASNVIYMNLFSGGTYAIEIRLNGVNLQYRDLSAAWQTIKVLVADIKYHIRIDFDCATDRFDCYVDGDKLITAGEFRNEVVNVDRFAIGCFNDDKITYWDAIGYSWDTDYTVGDNLQDWDWMRVSAIVQFPDITTRNNMYGYCSVILRDFEGALFPTWNLRDLTEMIVTDDSETLAKNCNVLFRGYLMNKKFHAKDLVLEIAGIGIMLYRRSFGSEEMKDYVLETGYPKTLNANTQIDLHDDDLANFDWEVDKWTKGDANVGLIIKDNTDGFVDNIYWDCKDPIAQTGGVVQEGDYSSTIAFDDTPYYVVKDESSIPNLVITATMDGALIAVTKKMKELQIAYSFRSQVYFDFFGGTWNVYLEIKKDSTWIEIDRIFYSKDSSSQHTSGWCQALPSSLKEGSSPHIITEGGDSTELAKYFTLDGGENNFASIELRLRCTGNLPGTAWGKVHVDYFRIRVIHHDDDVLPIMYKITESGLTGEVRWVKCADVPDWTKMGVTVDVDGFQIGENTTQIVQDIASYSGLNINVIPTKDLQNSILRPSADVSIEWTGSDVPHSGEIDDDVLQPDGDPGADDWIYAIDGDEIAVDEYEMDVLSTDNEYIDNISVWVYGYCGIDGNEDPSIDIYIDEAWQGYKTVNLGLDKGWHSVNWADLNLLVGDIGTPKIRIKAFTAYGAADLTYIYAVYMQVNHGLLYTWDKYMARKFKGQHCIEPLKAVLNLEGAEWMEDYVNNRIKLVKKADFEDSGVSLTQANYDHDWEYEDLCNEVKYVYVWGKTTETDNVFAKAVSTIASGEDSKQIVDNDIFSNPEAQSIADAQLALLEVKRPSIRIPLVGVNAALQLGTYVNVTMVRPTVAAADYKIRMIERFKHGKTGIKTIVYCGFGETAWDEKVLKEIERIGLESHKSLINKLTY